MQKIKSNLKYIKIKDILDFILFLLILPISLVVRLGLKIQAKKVWLICEAGREACDNGYHFYKYIRTKYPNDPVYYVIDKKAPDYAYVKKYDTIIQYRSIKHWLYYLSAHRNISTQKSGNPSPTLFYVIHVLFGLYQNRVFLQHGITKDDSEWLYFKNTKFLLFVCGARPEYDYILEKFGYPENRIAYLGFPRFDALTSKSKEEKQIFLFPTWRNWLGRETNALGEKIKFEDSEYFKRYNALLHNQKFITFLEKEKIQLYFMPHQNMRKYMSSFKSPSNAIKVVTPDDISVQQLMITSDMMLTDYSSAIMDFAYMKKPISYYQFDLEEYRLKQLQTGYYSYETDGFGPIFKEEDALLESIYTAYQCGFEMPDMYKKRVDSFFEMNDFDNCERVYQAIQKQK